VKFTWSLYKTFFPFLVLANENHIQMLALSCLFIGYFHARVGSYADHW
jgi:hypothetical protein